MKITILDCPPGEEEEIILKCRSGDENIIKLIRALKVDSEMLTVFSDEKFFQVSPRDILYFESVDDKVFAYLKNDVYEIKSKLYELEEKLSGTDFFRASKAALVNMSHIDHIMPEFNSRLLVTMQNGDRLLVTRQYAPELKRMLGLKS